MPTIVKESSTPATLETICHKMQYGSNHIYIKTAVPGYTDTIRYDSGPKYRNGHCVWKSCSHLTTKRAYGTIGTAIGQNPGYGEEYFMYGLVSPNAVSLPPLPTGVDYDRTVINDVLSQVDLNCRDTVLYYSGVLQAIPLVGGALRFNSIMKSLAKRLKKGMLHQPFTTVIKSAISLDFIDRFVVKPTIDDARKFNDAVNYIFRVYQTAHQRNSAPFALEASRTKVVSESSLSGTLGMIGRWGMEYSGTVRSQVTSKCFLWLEAGYDTAAINPIHLWATRTGLTRPLESAWDLVPFSFIIDYFTRAGDWIQSLGEEVDRQGALEGRISKIHACWGSRLVESIATLKGTRATHSRDSGAYIQYFVPNNRVIGTQLYERFPIRNPWLELTQFKGEDGFFNVNLSSTRKRTLAQLVIQARL